MKPWVTCALLSHMYACHMFSNPRDVDRYWANKERIKLFKTIWLSVVFQFCFVLFCLITTPVLHSCTWLPDVFHSSWSQQANPYKNGPQTVFLWKGANRETPERSWRDSKKRAAFKRTFRDLLKLQNLQLLKKLLLWIRTRTICKKKFPSVVKSNCRSCVSLCHYQGDVTAALRIK